MKMIILMNQFYCKVLGNYHKINNHEKWMIEENKSQLVVQ